MSDKNELSNPMLQGAMAYGAKLAASAAALSKVKDDDIDVGATPKTLTMVQDKVSLYHYDRPTAVASATGPVLIVYGLIGRYTMADLQEDRSLVRNLLIRGVDLYVVDWGHPDLSDQNLTLDDYVDWYLADCVERICAEAGVSQITLLGICEGGVFCTLFASLHPDKVRNLILTITPIDFHGDEVDDDESHGFINLWTRNIEDEDIRRLVQAFGNLPGEIMSSVFQMMTPVRTMTKYNLDLIEVASDDKKLLNFLRMEKWLSDRPHHPGAAALQWLIELYKENRLVKGTFELSGQRINLANLTMPVLNIYALQDHIIPPPCSKALRQHVGTSDYTEIALPGGHVGVYVSGKSQGIVGDGVFNWLMKRR